MRLSTRDALAVAVAVLAAVSAGYGDPGFLFWGVGLGLLMGLVALLPALGVIVMTNAAAASSGNPSTISDRLTLIALGATPGVAMTILPGNPSPVLLAAWLVVLVVWRRYAIIPLLRVTQ